MSHRDVTGAMADHWKAEHDKARRQRDQLREALVEIAHSNACDHDDMQCVRIARAALKATEDGQRSTPNVARLDKAGTPD